VFAEWYTEPAVRQGGTALSPYVSRAAGLSQAISFTSKFEFQVDQDQNAARGLGKPDGGAVLAVLGTPTRLTRSPAQTQ